MSGPEDSLFLRAARREPVDRPPVWMMRQAGRYLSEYRAVREKASFLDLCYTPELAAEVSLQPMRRFEFDAAIIFSDILVPLIPMGAPFHFDAGPPKLEEPLDTPQALAKLHKVDARKDLPWIHEALARVRAELDASKAVLGFAGAPFTLLCYLVEGEGSRHFPNTKKLLWTEPETAREVLDLLATQIGEYLVEQVKSGADAVQLFDTWGGLLTPDDFQTWALPAVRKIMDHVARETGAPTIYYVNGNPAVLELQASSGCSIVGLDWRHRLDEAARVIPDSVGMQGNLDPVILLTDPDTVRAATLRMLDTVAHRPGYVCNLGHGVTPPTPVENVEAFVQAVHDWAPITQEGR